MHARLALLLAGLVAACLAAPAAGLQSAARAPGSRVWMAKWIWTPGEPSPPNSYTYFRKVVEVEKDLT